MKVFISQPMANKNDEFILMERERVEEILNGQFPDDEVNIIDSYFPGQDMTNPVKCLSKAISALADADLVYFAKGWRSARGCKIEYQIATKYGKVVIVE